MSRFPATPSEISIDWLNVALNRVQFPEVRQLSLERLGETDSVSGFVVRAHLTFAGDSDAPRSVIVKLPVVRAQRSPILRQFYRREVGFYRALASTVGARVPRCYYSDLDEETDDYVLVLEDFPDHRAGSNSPRASDTDATAAIREMAHLHARWWNSPQLRDHPFLGRESDFIDRASDVVRDELPRFLERFGHQIAPEELAVFEALPARFRESALPLLDAPSTLIHRDLSMKNTLIGGDPGHPTLVLIDWQQASIGPAVRDVSFFVENSVAAEDWPTERALLEDYHSELLANDVVAYDFDQLLEDYRRSVLCDLARIVAFGSRSKAAPTADIVRHEIEGRTGSAAALDLMQMLHARPPAQTEKTLSACDLGADALSRSSEPVDERWPLAFPSP